MTESEKVQVKLELNHKAASKTKPTPEGFTHDWQMTVRGPNGSKIENFVEKVIFYLHESFKKPKRVVKEPPYSIAESGYAGFTLPIDVCFRNKDEPKKITFMYDLFLHAEGCPPVNNTRCEKLTFENPTPEFRSKLLKAGAYLLNVDHESPPAVPRSPSPPFMKKTDSEPKPISDVMKTSLKPEKSRGGEEEFKSSSESKKSKPLLSDKKKPDVKDVPKTIPKIDSEFTDLFGSPIKSSETEWGKNKSLKSNSGQKEKRPSSAEKAKDNAKVKDTKSSSTKSLDHDISKKSKQDKTESSHRSKDSFTSSSKSKESKSKPAQKDNEKHVGDRDKNSSSSVSSKSSHSSSKEKKSTSSSSKDKLVKERRQSEHVKKESKKDTDDDDDDGDDNGDDDDDVSLPTSPLSERPKHDKKSERNAEQDNHRGKKVISSREKDRSKDRDREKLSSSKEKRESVERSHEKPKDTVKDRSEKDKVRERDKKKRDDKEKEKSRSNESLHSLSSKHSESSRSKHQSESKHEKQDSRSKHTSHSPEMKDKGKIHKSTSKEPEKIKKETESKRDKPESKPKARVTTSPDRRDKKQEKDHKHRDRAPEVKTHTKKEEKTPKTTPKKSPEILKSTPKKPMKPMEKLESLFSTGENSDSDDPFDERPKRISSSESEDDKSMKSAASFDKLKVKDKPLASLIKEVANSDPDSPLSPPPEDTKPFHRSPKSFFERSPFKREDTRGFTPKERLSSASESDTRKSRSDSPTKRPTTFKSATPSKKPRLSSEEDPPTDPRLKPRNDDRARKLSYDSEHNNSEPKRKDSINADIKEELEVSSSSSDSESDVKSDNDEHKPDRGDSPLEFNEEYLIELVKIQQTLMASRDRDLVQKVVDLVGKTDCFDVDVSFNFDLCSLDKNTVHQIRDLLQCAQ